MAQIDLKAELNPYDPPSNPIAYAAAIIVGIGIIVAIVFTVLYGAGVFDDDSDASTGPYTSQIRIIELEDIEGLLGGVG